MNKIDILKTKNLLRQFLAIFLFSIILLFNYSCEEDPSALGSEILPDSDKLTYHFDSTFTFKGSVYEDEPINTSNMSYYSLGIIKDNEHFGEFKGSYVGQYLPDIYNAYFNGFFIDSAFVFIQIDSLYGDALNNIDFRLYEISEKIEEDGSYMSNTDITTFNPEFIGSLNKYLGDTAIKMNLNYSFISKLTSADSATYSSSVNFKDEFNGIALMPDLINEPGGLVTTNFASANSKMVLYFNDTTFTYSFSGGHGFAAYSNDFTGTQAENYLNNPEEDNDELLYVQGIPGETVLKSKISLTNFDSWLDTDSAYSVLSAELFIPVYKDNNFDQFYPPNLLFLSYDNTDSSFVYVKDCEDYVRRGVKIFDGRYDEENNYYHFYIPRHLVKVFNQDIESTNFYISAEKPSYNATTYSYDYNYYPQRVILKSGNNIKLEVTYTKH
ncbi:MAG: DUF4270 domain-containing protein [Bacteroidetes bacterium]|nr:DUF4270 domain-containing protein [Bacteroidota bacterium]